MSVPKPQVEQLVACAKCVSAQRAWPIALRQLLFGVAAPALVAAASARPPDCDFGHVLCGAEAAAPWACEGEGSPLCY